MTDQELKSALFMADAILAVLTLFLLWTAKARYRAAYHSYKAELRAGKTQENRQHRQHQRERRAQKDKPREMVGC